MMNKVVKVIIVVVFAGIYLGILIYNIINNKTFLDAPVYHMLNIAVAIIVAYYFVQRRNDERKLKEIVVEILDKMQSELQNEIQRFENSDFNRRKTLQFQRKINNKITMINVVKEKLNIIVDVDYINNNFSQYKDIIGESLDQIDPATHRELRKIIDGIDSKCDSIKIKLFK